MCRFGAAPGVAGGCLAYRRRRGDESRRTAGRRQPSCREARVECETGRLHATRRRGRRRRPPSPYPTRPARCVQQCNAKNPYLDRRRRPLPARLVASSAESELAQSYDLEPSFGELPNLIGLLEALQHDINHRSTSIQRELPPAIRVARGWRQRAWKRSDQANPARRLDDTVANSCRDDIVTCTTRAIEDAFCACADGQCGSCSVVTFWGVGTDHAV